MNLLQLRNMARLRLDDKQGERLWGDDELDLYINQAINEAHIRSRNLVDSSSACTLINVVAGQSSYGMSPAIFYVDRVFDINQGLYLIKTGVDELDSCFGRWESATGTTPTHYIEDINHQGTDCYKDRSIRLYPAPTVPTQLRLTVYRTQSRPLSDNDEPKLPSYQHADLIWWVLHLAYQKADSDSYNIKDSLACEQHFAQAFGEKQSARLLEYRRKHRKMHVVGQYL
jgi:hypothetical protein